MEWSNFDHKKFNYMSCHVRQLFVVLDIVCCDCLLPCIQADLGLGSDNDGRGAYGHLLAAEESNL